MKQVDANKAAELIKQTRRYARTILDSLSAHVAIIDENGVILETNRAWMAFARSNLIRMRPDTLNVNYLRICEAAKGESSNRSREVADGIRRVISGQIEEFVIDYPCHSPDCRRWFYMRVTRAVGAGPLRVVISHEDITALKNAERRLRQREAELQRKTAHLEEANAAMRALLRQREEDKKEMEQALFQNMRQTVLPYIERLKQAPRASERRYLIDLIEAGLAHLASPFLQRLAGLEAVLTPHEFKIAVLVREGRPTKEIACLLGISPTTVNFHRRNLRRKLGLKNKPLNLRTHLLSLEK